MELFIVLSAIALLAATALAYITGKKAAPIGHTKVAMSEEMFHETMLETADLFMTEDNRGICIALEHSSAPYMAKRLIAAAIMNELSGHVFLSGWLVKRYGTDVDKDTMRAVRICWLRESIRLGGIAHLNDIMRVHFPHMKRKIKK